MDCRSLTTLHQHYNKYWLISSLLLLALLENLVRADCPVSYLPEDMLSGTIRAQVVNNYLKSPYTQMFYYVYTSAIGNNNNPVNFSIAVFGLYYTSGIYYSYKINSAQNSKNTIGQFSITMTGCNIVYTNYYFSFIAASSNLLLLGNIALSVVNEYRTLIVPLSDRSWNKDKDNISLQLFHCGLSVSIKYSRKTEERYTMGMNSIMLTKEGIQFSINFDQKKHVVKEVCVSYVVFDKIALQEQNNWRVQQFQLIARVRNYFTMETWQKYGIFIVGLMQLTYGYNRDNRFLLKNSSDKTTKYFFDRSSETASYTFSYLQIVRNAKYLCKSCKTGGILYDGNTCTNRCPSPFVNYTVNGRQYCYLCDPTKLLIMNKYKTKCVCSNMAYVDDNGVCKLCDHSCYSCLTGKTCTTCGYTTIYHRQLINNLCACEQGYYDNGNTQVCDICHNDCITCSGKSDKYCLYCKTNSVKDIYSRCACLPGYIRNDEGNCVCDGGRIISDNNCVDMVTRSLCGRNYVRKQLTKNEPYHGRIDILTSPCDCMYGYYRIKGECKTCDYHSVYNLLIGYCYCYKGYYWIDYECIKCKQGYRYDLMNKKCVCANGHHLNDVDYCMLCKSKQILIDNYCTCVSGYRFVEEEDKCVRCVDVENCQQIIPVIATYNTAEGTEMTTIIAVPAMATTTTTLRTPTTTTTPTAITTPTTTTTPTATPLAPPEPPTTTITTIPLTITTTPTTLTTTTTLTPPTPPQTANTPTPPTPPQTANTPTPPTP